MITIHIFNPDELAEQGTAVPDLCRALDALGPKLGLGAFRFTWKGRKLRLRLAKQTRTKWSPTQWVMLFDQINDVLDRYHVIAIAQSRGYRFRIGLHRRITFDCALRRYSPHFGWRPLTAVFYGRMGDYQPRPESKVVDTYGTALERMITWT